MPERVGRTTHGLFRDLMSDSTPGQIAAASQDEGFGLSARHAHLAVNASVTWCQLMLDTLADSQAPWHRHQDRQQTGSAS